MDCNALHVVPVSLQLVRVPGFSLFLQPLRQFSISVRLLGGSLERGAPSDPVVHQLDVADDNIGEDLAVEERIPRRAGRAGLLDLGVLPVVADVSQYQMCSEYRVQYQNLAPPDRLDSPDSFQ